jgi:hypothetical protein
VRTTRDPYLGNDPGDNVLIIDFDSHPLPIPEPILASSPTPSPTPAVSPSTAP